MIWAISMELKGKDRAIRAHELRQRLAAAILKLQKDAADIETNPKWDGIFMDSGDEVILKLSPPGY